jgi:hypothetical protein
VTNFARSLSPAGAGRVSLSKAAVVLACTLVLVCLALLIVAATAGAVVTSVGPVTVGLEPRVGAYAKPAEPEKYANAEGNPVLHGTNTFAIYWDPTDHYHGDWQNVIDTYFHNAGAASGGLASVFAVATQYTDKTNHPAAQAQAFKGAYTDTTPYPKSGCTDPAPFVEADRIGPEVAGKKTSVCLTGAQVAAEVEGFVKAHQLPKGLGSVYFLLTPPGAAVCLDEGGETGHCSDYEEGNETSRKHSFCSYHADVNPGGLPGGDANTILYAVIPWTAGGFGDPLLEAADRTAGWECQDGGLNPAGKHGYEVEKEKVRDPKEQKEFEEKNPEQQAEIEATKKREGPHEEEPNQPEKCPDVFDGGCDTGLADLIISQIGLEQVNAITDPLLNGWRDPTGAENTDECRFLYGAVVSGSPTANEESLAGTLADESLDGGSYYLNDAFNLASLQLPYPGSGCLHHVNLAPTFTAPNLVNAGEIVGFDGMESNITLNAATAFDAKGAPTLTYATYTWNFGDGSAPVTGFAPGAPACETPWLTPCAASALHSYQYGGVYTVTLTVTDTGGHTATMAQPVTVVGPPPPTPPAPEGGGSKSAGAGGAAGPSGGSASVTPAVPAPVAAAAVLSRRLGTIGRSGVVVRYTVNEQVAGRFEVLLDRALARRLGISGTPAYGLPTGWAPQLVVGKALLVTTRAGGSTVKIQLSKHTAQRLGRLRKVSMLLRMVVRNASHSPTSTTVLTTFTLSR